jgi:hypothetical protein
LLSSWPGEAPNDYQLSEAGDPIKEPPLDSVARNPERQLHIRSSTVASLKLVLSALVGVFFQYVLRDQAET